MATIRALDGFFTRDSHISDDTTAAAATTPRLFKKFALATDSWADLQTRVADVSAQGRDIKVVYLVRHAEGFHNAAERDFGTQRWEEEFAKTDAYLDADLTPFGISDAQNKGPSTLAAECAKGMPTIERVVVSTLSRAIQTAEIFFADYPLPPQSQSFVGMELCREILGVHTCDKRVSLTKLKRKFPRVDFAFKGAEVQDEEDELWSPMHRETDAEIQARVRAFLLQFFDAIPDRYVALVVHSKFIRSLYEMLRPGEADVYPANCEVIPMVLERVKS